MLHATQHTSALRLEYGEWAGCREGWNGADTYNRVLELKLLLLAVRDRLVLFRLLGAPDRVSLFPQLIL